MIFRNIWLAKTIEKDAGVKFGVGVTSIFLREGRGGRGGGDRKRIKQSREFKTLLRSSYFG